MKLASTAAFVSLAFVAKAALAGPFGFEMGMTLAEVQHTGTVTPSKSRHVYTLTREPSSAAPFIAYQLFITPTFGLCKIVAIGPVFKTSADGAAVQSAFREQKKALEGRYGNPILLDDLKSSEAKPVNWMTGLAKQVQSLSASWYEGGRSNLGEGLQAVKLEANGLSSERGYLSVAYEFRNFADCQTEDRESGRAGL